MYYFIVCMCHTFYNHSSISKYIWFASIFWLLWIMLQWTWVCRYPFKMQLEFFWVYTRKWESWNTQQVLFLISWEASMPFFIVAVQIYIPTKSTQGFQFLWFVNSICISLVISDPEHLFLCLLVLYISSLEKYLFKSFAHIFKNFIGVQLIYNIVLVSGVEQSDSVLYIYACVLSHFSHVQLSVTLWTVAHQAPLSKGFSRQEY